MQVGFRVCAYTALVRTGRSKGTIALKSLGMSEDCHTGRVNLIMRDVPTHPFPCPLRPCSLWNHLLPHAGELQGARPSHPRDPACQLSMGLSLRPEK